MMMINYSLLLIILLQSSINHVFAHFTLDYPTSRGFNDDTESTAPCGNFNTVSSNRTQFPLSNGFVEIYSGHTSYSYTVNVIINNDLTGNYSNNDLVQVATGSRNYPQNACLSLDLGKNAAIKDGMNGTIQVTFDGGDGVLYQCADVIFETNAAGWNNSVCINDDTASRNSNPAVATNTTSTASTLTTTSYIILLTAFLICLIKY